MRRGHRTRRRRNGALAGLAAVACLTTVACSGGDASPQSTSTTSSTVALRPEPPDDGVLKIGVLRPADAATADVAASIVDGVSLAIADIRATGQRVELHLAEEGEASKTRASIEELVDQGVDAIVGPMSSNVALATLSTGVRLGVPMCSPTATSLALDDYPDRGLFFRTIPSDRLQARALARVVDRTGAGSAALLNLDDGYGRPLADVVEAELRAQGTTVRRYPFARDERSIGIAAVDLSATPAPVMIVISDERSAPAVVEAVTRALGAASSSFVVTDSTLDALGDLPDDLLSTLTITGVSARVRPASTSTFGKRFAQASNASGAFAENAFDCVNLFALAAAEASATTPSAIAANMVGVSISGSVCADYTTCLPLVRDGRNIDYGSLNLSADGEVAEATFDVFDLDADGNSVYRRSTTISR